MNRYTENRQATKQVENRKQAERKTDKQVKCIDRQTDRQTDKGRLINKQTRVPGW